MSNISRTNILFEVPLITCLILKIDIKDWGKKRKYNCDRLAHLIKDTFHIQGVPKSFNWALNFNLLA